ncbi:MAG TPA: hypothetical protein VH912_17770 [Streptosporangiaceae bacterium]|jgi:hypothetical protein
MTSATRTSQISAHSHKERKVSLLSIELSRARIRDVAGRLTLRYPSPRGDAVRRTREDALTEAIRHSHVLTFR